MVLWNIIWKEEAKERGECLFAYPKVYTTSVIAFIIHDNADSPMILITPHLMSEDVT